MKHIFDDGGRELSGHKGFAGDCVTRSISIASGIPYKVVYDEINKLSTKERIGKRKTKKSNSRTGVFKSTYHKYILSIGFTWIPTMFIGSGCKVHLRETELPQKGNLIVALSKHMTCVIDGEIHDTYNPDREGSRCVYGYYIKE